MESTHLSPALSDKFFWRYCPNPLLLVDIGEAYNELNHRFFHGALPAYTAKLVKWEGRFRRCLGTYNPTTEVIKLSKKLAGDRNAIYSVLLHEMLHKFLDRNGLDDGVEGHGPNFIRFASDINSKAEALGLGYRINFMWGEVTEDPKLVCKDLGITLVLDDLDVAVKARRLAERVFNNDYVYRQ